MTEMDLEIKEAAEELLAVHGRHAGRKACDILDSLSNMQSDQATQFWRLICQEIDRLEGSAASC